jgi:predicted phosphate transport protein (TIGR00153 family)
LVDLGFLSFRKEKSIIEGVGKHLSIVSETVDGFIAAVGSAAVGDAEGARKHAEDVFSKEQEADTVHRELSLRIAQGAFFGGVREDILALLEAIDNIADSAKDAIRFLSSDSALSEDGRMIFMSEHMTGFLGSLKLAVDALKSLIASFDRGKKEILSRVHSVEEFEEKADSHKDLLLKELFAKAESMSPVTVIQLRDFIFMSDDIADNAEDASDVILVLVAKGYG